MTSDKKFDSTFAIHCVALSFLCIVGCKGELTEDTTYNMDFAQIPLKDLGLDSKIRDRGIDLKNSSDSNIDSGTNLPNTGQIPEELKAFPSAYGGGAIATGGRFDPATTQLVIVNTLNPNQPLSEIRPRVWEGGLDAALTQDFQTPRFIVFDVSGQIDVGLSPGPDGSSRAFGESIETEAPGRSNISLLGQTAPRGGVTIINGYIHIKRNRNIIFRYLSVRPKLITGNPITDDERSTGISLPGREVIIDHCSSSWGGDKSIIAADWQPGYPNKNTIEDARANVLKFSRNSNTWVWPTIPSNLRPANFDTDKGGMADAWEIRTFQTLNEDFFGDADGDGYLNIEEYANQVDY